MMIDPVLLRRAAAACGVLALDRQLKKFRAASGMSPFDRAQLDKLRLALGTLPVVPKGCRIPGYSAWSPLGGARTSEALPAAPEPPKSLPLTSARAGGYTIH
jgi:hypothetical protein